MIIKPLYNANNQPVTFSGLDSLADQSTVFSAVIDNTANLDLDALLSASFVTGSGTSATGTINIVVAASADGGTTFPTDPTACKLLGVINANVDGSTFVLDAASIAALYGGQLPPYFLIGIINNTGTTLGAGNRVFYQRTQTQLQ